MYWTTSRALALSWIDELDPLNWKIFDLVSRINMSSWLRDNRAKGTWWSKTLHPRHPDRVHQGNKFCIWLYMSLASFTWTTCFPLQTYNRVSCSCSFISVCLNPDATPPRIGRIHGLKYERNFSVSCPCTSRYWTARPPRAASSSIVLIAAVPASS